MKKNMGFLVIPKSQKFGKKVEKIGWAPLKLVCSYVQYNLRRFSSFDGSHSHPRQKDVFLWFVRRKKPGFTILLSFSGVWYGLLCNHEFAVEVMTSFNHIVIPARGNWFQTNSQEHEHDESDRCVHLLCVFYQWQRYSSSVANYDQHLSLYCGSVKPKFKTGSEY